MVMFRPFAPTVWRATGAMQFWKLHDEKEKKMEHEMDTDRSWWQIIVVFGPFAATVWTATGVTYKVWMEA